MTPDQTNQLITLGVSVIIALGGLAIQVINARKETAKQQRQQELVKAQVTTELDKKKQELDNQAKEQDLKRQQVLIEIAADQLRQRTDHENDMEALKTSLAREHQRDVAALKQTLTKERETAIATLKTSLAREHETEIATLKRENQTQVQGLNIKMENLQTSVNTLNGQLGDKEKELTTEKAKNGEYKQQIEGMKLQIETLENKVRELQAKVGTGNLTPPADPTPSTPI